MYRSFKYLVAFAFVVNVHSQTKVSISGTIKDNSGKSVNNAIVRLESLGYVTVTDINGAFNLDNTSPVLPKESRKLVSGMPVVKNGFAFFSVTSSTRLQFNIFSLQGRLCKKVDAGNLDKGDYSVDLAGLFSKSFGNGTYLITGILGDQKFSYKILMNSSREIPLQVKKTDVLKNLNKVAQSSSVDRLIITKLGMETKVVELSSYETQLGTLQLAASYDITAAGVIGVVEDSLFELLVKRVEKLDSVESPDDMKSIDYISIRNGFEVILAHDSTRFKSNVGLIISSLLSLNSNKKIWNLVDSIDAYIEEVDNYLNGNEPVEPPTNGNGLLKRTMRKGGVLALGKAMAATTAQMATAQAQKPSFPRFITLSYIQGTIESELLPVLNNTITIADRIEKIDNASMSVHADDDTYELDKGEIFLFDAYARWLRAYMKMYCTYNYDVFSSASDQSYSWIDSMIIFSEESGSKNIYTLKNDTLYRIHSSDDAKFMVNMVKAYKYNLEERPAFLTIRNGYHASILEDLKSVPVKIKAGIAAVKNEIDDQDDDLIKISMIDTADQDMIDFSNDMIEEGFTPAFAQNFSSISKVMDFVTEILSGPYTFDQTIDSQRIQLTINLSAFFTNPVQDLRKLLPKYTWVDQNTWVKKGKDSESVQKHYSYRDVFNPATGTFTTLYYISVYDDEEIEMNIDQSLIDSVVENTYSTYYYIKTPIRYQVSIDSNSHLEPIYLVDDVGIAISWDKIDSLIDNKTFFPYFNDYTFNGVFPDMTRAKWLDLIY